MSTSMSVRSAALQELNQDTGSPRYVRRIGPTTGDQVTGHGPDLARRADAAAGVAAAHAVAVDHESRFPREALDAMRFERLLSVAVPRQLGGEGANISEVADICYTLGRACASSAMIYAMHQVSVACLVRHGNSSDWHQSLLRRLCDEQLLLASSTTEGSNGGDLRNSGAAITHADTAIRLERQASVISYGEIADGIITTARRSPDAPSSDQVLVAFLRRDYALERIAGWNAFGMRGTCSEGFKLVAAGVNEQILPVAYSQIHAQTMVPIAHLSWSAAWAGIAASAVDRARGFVRKASLRPGGSAPPGAPHLTRANATLRTLRSLISTVLQRFESCADDVNALESIDFQTTMSMLKVSASELAVATVMSAMQACGLSGYRNDSEFSVGRHLRDILSSPIMISNDRILANAAAASLLSGPPNSLRD